MKTTAERIKEGLEARNMKQSDLAEKTKISKGALSSYITGRYIPKQNNIYLIARALNVSEAWLMGHDVPMERNSAPDSGQTFLSYLYSLGYYLSRDDPEHKPFLTSNGTTVRLEYDTLDSLKLRIDSYAKATVDSEMLTLKEEEIRQERLEKERLIRQLRGENISTGSQFEKDWSEKKAKEASEKSVIQQFPSADAQILKAAHERTDIEVTDKMRKADDDIMDDDNF